MNAIPTLRVEVREALSGVESALADLESPKGRPVRVLEDAFNDAKKAHDKLDSKLAIAEARSRLPVEPALDNTVEVSNRAYVSRSPLTYERHAPCSIFRDMYTAKHGNPDALERLRRHTDEMVVEGRALSQTAGQGGDFIPPVWLHEWIELPRASRPITNTLNRQQWVPGTNSINVPKIEAGATVAVQTDGGAVSSTDIKTQAITGTVQTIAGQQDLSQQLLDLSSPGIDQVIFDDLMRAYDAKVEAQTITGAVANAKGINELAGTNAITFTEASPKVGKMYSKIASAINEITLGIFRPPTVIAMHPSRWNWVLAALDTQERPLVVPVGAPGFNASALQSKVAAENVVGQMFGIPVIASASIPVNKGAGTNQDEVFVYRAEELFFWEDTPRLRVFEQVLSNTLQVRVQVYNYTCQIFGRLPKAISKVQGTGLVAASF